MIFLLPIVMIIALIVTVDYLYFSDVKPHDVPPSKEVRQTLHDSNVSKNYLDRYIQK